VHAKTHGLLVGELTVEAGLPEVYAQGLFARPGSYPVVMRLSTTPGDILADDVSTPRGMAIKVSACEGAARRRQRGRRDAGLRAGQRPVFSAPNAKKFLGNAKLLAATTDKAPNLKRLFSAVARGAEKALEAVGGESVTLKALGGHPETHPLGETYFSQVPILYGRLHGEGAGGAGVATLTALTDAAGRPQEPAGRLARRRGRPFRDPRRRVGSAHPAVHGPRQDADRGRVGRVAGRPEPVRDGGAPARGAAAGL
jgi:hypothetical protein